MQTIAINIQNEEVSEKLFDLKQLAATRNEESIPFREYLNNEC